MSQAAAGQLQFQRSARRVLRGDLQLNVPRADMMELLGHDVTREFGPVALSAQMRQEKMLQPRGHDLRDSFGGGRV